jgi:tetratricopeptide (TPR) repeat protein
MKFRDVAMRGPWTSGGIEFNFGLIGHTPATANPVDYALRQNEDGSVSCIVGSIDLPSRTQWRVEIRLPADAAEFETRSFWYNPTPLTQSYYHWMNAAVHAREDLQFYYPGQYYIGHGGDAHPWPVNENGVDLSLYKNHHFGGHKSLHVLGSNADFSGGYWHDLGFGFGHWSKYDDMPGRKIWIWSLSRSGAIWEDLLTDRNGQYVEVQAGRQFSQAQLSSGGDTPFTQAAFLPYAADSWREVWFPVKQIGGLAGANPDAALNVTRTGDKTRIALNALRPLHSDLIVTAGDTTVLRERLNLSPMQVIEREIAIPAAQSGVRVMLGSECLWDSTQKPEAGFARPVVSPADKASSTAERNYQLGRQQELLRDYNRALEFYGECVKADPLHVAAMSRVAELHYRRMEYDQASLWAKKALAIDTYYPAANFVLGATLRKLGNLNAAREALGWAARSAEFRSAAYTLTAETLLKEGRFEAAAEYARRALDFNRANLPALGAAAIAARKLGRSGEAAGIHRQMLDLDPLSHFGLAEAWLTNSSNQSQTQFTSAIRSELPHESYLELAAYYAGNGMEPEANRILRLAPPHPLVHYWLAYLTRNSAPAESKAFLDKAEGGSPRLVFPAREETSAVLQWALAKQRDWKTLYYIALIDWSRGRFAEAAALLAECGMSPDYGPFYLARAELAKRNGQEPAMADYRRARELAPDEWRAGLALARRLSGSPAADAAGLETAKAGYDRFPKNFVLGMEYAKRLIDAKSYQAALAILDRLAVLPYENASEGRVLFEKAHLLLAGELIRGRKYQEALSHIAKSREWPEHLGVGKPYDPDERLQAVMEAYCARKLGKGAAEPDRVLVDKLVSDLKRSGSWKLDLVAALR